MFRIDHYLGKEPVQNLLYFRFANSVAQAIWSGDHVASVQINMPETFDVSDRGAFYDAQGAVRDVVQNHMLEVVTMLAMEPPSAGSTDTFRAEQTKVLEGDRAADSGRHRSRPVQGLSRSSKASLRDPRWRPSPPCACT